MIWTTNDPVDQLEVGNRVALLNDFCVNDGWQDDSFSVWSLGREHDLHTASRRRRGNHLTAPHRDPCGHDPGGGRNFLARSWARPAAAQVTTAAP